jgi:hypothetical protein
MTSSRRLGATAGPAATALLLSACGIGNVLGDQVSVIYVYNDTPTRLYAGATDYDDGPGFGDDVPPTRGDEVIWTSCKTAWLVLQESGDPSAVELAREELTLCPGDTVTINPGHELTVECGEESLGTREIDC